MLAGLAQLDFSLKTVRDRLKFVLVMTEDESKTYTTASAFALAGSSFSTCHEPLKACFYEVRKPHHWYQLPRLYKFDRFARAFIQALLERHEEASASPK